VAKRSRAAYRGDIEGLRAVAVVTVVLCHAGLAVFAGGYVGVDVFFVISGFLISGLLVGELERTGRISLSAFYGRRAKRLLPMAAILLAFVAVLSAILFSPLRRDQVSGDIVASALSVVNWRFAAHAIDYFASTQEASPLQHFWSLAVEEQFYLVWPSLLLIVTWWRRRAGKSVRPVVWAALVVIAAGSFAYGVYLTANVASVAYFSTLTRAWELAVGGLLALLLTGRGSAVIRRIPRPLAYAIGAAGLVAIGLATVLYSESTAFPGTAALMPVLGAAAIIFAGVAAPLPVLDVAPMRYVGKISYSWYLWHWPLLVFASEQWGPLSARQGLAVVAFSLVPTIVGHHLIEERFHRSPTLSARPARALRLGAVCIAVAVVGGLLLSSTAPSVRTASAREVAGAAALTSGAAIQRTADKLRPNPRDADGDQPKMYGGCFVGHEGLDSPACVYGDRHSKTTVVLFGDSHAMMWGPAMDAAAKRRGWRLVTLAKQGCTVADVPIYNAPLGREYDECDTWRARTLRRIAREKPSLIVVDSVSRYEVMDGDSRSAPYSQESVRGLTDGTARTLRRLRATGAPVVIMGGTPTAPTNVPACVSDALHDLETCAFAKAGSVEGPPVNADAAARVGDVTVVDALPVLCPGDTCPAVIGDVLVYRDNNHITATYSRTLGPWLSRQLPPVRK
jgi:peptidoglycan/LPS O-acetylase OafA/YrhL